MARREEYEGAARAIAQYLAERQRPDGGFPGPENYGLSFGLWLWSAFGTEFSLQLARAWKWLEHDPPASHTEFNAYALLQCREQFGADPVDALLRQMRLGRRHSANWMLLRASCRAQPGPFYSPVRANWEARSALMLHARRGFIADRWGVRSLAYHAFCGALLADLWGHRRSRWAARASLRAAHFAASLVLPNGDSLYVGRGQQQIFGYAALVYLLEAAHRLTGNRSFTELAGCVFRYLLGFQRPDGSFPLVLREGEPAEPWLPDSSRPGWYTYNRYADYLPLLGCFLLKAAHAELPSCAPVALPGTHPDFRTHKEGRYLAVWARPGGAPTNDLPFPYLCVDGESLLPCYGAEGDEVQAQASPLPYGLKPDGEVYAFRERLRYRLTHSGMTGVSPLVHHERHFKFQPDGFLCRDTILFQRQCTFSEFTPANFLFRTLRQVQGGEFETWHRDARARLQVDPAASICPDAAVTASGPLVALRHTRGKLEARTGDSLATELRVRFL